MTYIKRLILDGFKTFGNKTIIDFGKDLNVIVGPNGSGKSNISDAICFVLGRSNTRTLRAERITDFIYHGGKSGKPKDRCEVSIIFDNSNKEFPLEDKEIKITRIVKKEGSSVYKINNKVTTRQEILSLLAKVNINPEGYNIVLQDDITSFITLSSKDKRLIIEEVAGILIYRERKEKAEKELENVEQRIKDAKIILEERRQSLRDLELERKDALRYKKLQDEVRSLRYNILRLRKENKEKQISKLDESIRSVIASINEKENAKNKFKEELSLYKNQLNKISQEIENKGEKDQIELNKDLEELRVKKATLQSDINNYREQIRNIDIKSNRIRETIKELKEQKKTFEQKRNEILKILQNEEKNLDTINKKLEDFRKRLNLESLDELNTRINKIDEEVDKINQQIQQEREKLQSFIREKDRIQIELESIDKKIEKIESLKKQHKQELEQINKLKQEFKNLTLELAELLNRDSIVSNKLIKLRRELSNLKEEEVKLNIKSLEIKELIQRNSSLKAILNLKNEISGIYGTVAELGTVSKDYELALSMAAGQRMNYVVVENEDVAAYCIKYLKKNKLPPVSFIPLNRIRVNRVDKSLKNRFLSQEGVIGFAIDLIKFDSHFKKAFEYVFGDTLVVRNVDIARRIGVGNIRMVTLDGDLIERTGVMFGGYVSRSKNIPKFMNNETQRKLEDVEKRIIKISEELEDLEKEKETLAEKIDFVRKKKAELEGEIVKKEKSLYIEDSDLEASETKKKELEEREKNLSELIDKKQVEISKLLRRITDFKIEKQQLKAKIAQISDPSRMAELRAYEESKEAIINKINSIRSELSKVETKLEIINRDLNESIRVLEDLNKQRVSFEKEMKESLLRLDELTKTIKEKENLVKQFYSEFKELFQKRSETEKKIDEIENRIYEINAEIQGLNQRLTHLKVKQSELRVEVNGLKRSMSEFVDVKIIDGREEELQRKLDQLTKEIESMGAINLRAIEVYEKASEEFRELEERLNKLNKEREDVINLIKEIEEKRRDIFLKTFEKINNNFQAIFKKLAPKGEAFLELENNENPFEGGLKLKVRLNKSNFIELRSLSGGEKALTALSFLFALQEYQPSSFYILDEVDAPLDPMNSKELAKWIKEYSNKAQYIVITHNDSIVAEANYLFGVSMDKDKNLSKILSLKVT